MYSLHINTYCNIIIHDSDLILIRYIDFQYRSALRAISNFCNSIMSRS